jgi:predicted RNase H-like nuclease
LHAGWVAAIAERWPPSAPPDLYIYSNFQALLAATQDCRIVVVDMPIGLPAGVEHRLCDIEGRVRLGAAATRLFYAPPRPALEVLTAVEFQALHRKITGKGAGLPLWGIVPKLRQADATMTPALQQRVCEFHPELAWQYLAGAALPSKHRKEGIARGLALLRDSIPELDAITAPHPGYASQGRRTGRSARCARGPGRGASHCGWPRPSAAHTKGWAGD